MDYKDYNDYELLNFVSESDEANEILYAKYRPFIEITARKMYKYCQNKGIDTNDLIQEGMIALNHAIKTFDETKDVTFYTYAKTCIERKLISEIVATKRLKHKILNESLSLELANEDGEDVNVENLLGDNSYNPEQILMNYEINKELIEEIRLILTDYEEQVFDLKINDFSYKEIAEILDRSPKAVDNAIQRIKIKIKEYLKNKM